MIDSAEDVDMDQDTLESTAQEIGGRKYYVERHLTCKADCDCPPLLARTDVSPGGSEKCGRCGNKGHKALVRGLDPNRSTFVSGSYDSSVRVSSMISSG
jgi:hypothetical protein